MSDFNIKPKRSKPARQSKCCDRVVVPNVVYLMNLPEKIASDEVLRSTRFLGQYGRIEKIILHKNGTAHATFVSINSAQRCIRFLDNFQFNGSRISALVGTTKYPEDVDLPKILNNCANESPVPRCENPIFPSPYQQHVPFHTPFIEQPNCGTTQDMRNIYPANHLIEPIVQSSLQSCRASPVPTSSELDSEENRHPFKNLVFGTGGLVHSMWVGDMSLGTPNADNQQESAPRANLTVEAFVPKPNVLLDWDECKSLDGSLSSETDCDMSSTLTVSETSLNAISMYTDSAAMDQKQTEDFWSSSNESDNGDDLESTMFDDLSISIDIETDGEIGRDSITEETGADYTSLPFSPCKEMVRALTANAWKPEDKFTPNTDCFTVSAQGPEYMQQEALHGIAYPPHMPPPPHHMSPPYPYQMMPRPYPYMHMQMSTQAQPHMHHILPQQFAPPPFPHPMGPYYM
eukprot:CAMPEP_0182417112 /NCGR_PEP_ID=MMETSP1167-20130531/1523_1 /TAXON_ID=2988 /ORGANISM="Mallomonas Sp, Strain CCMP3275" /LENGTH=459 /DNA_ID=CAMNT_0024590419 /DNA_START=186 /DNA_END=1565 /DNA_ORIENTATION=+